MAKKAAKKKTEKKKPTLKGEVNPRRKTGKTEEERKGEGSREERQGKSTKRPTHSEYNARLDIAYRALLEGRYRDAMIRQISKETGVSLRVARDYLTRAEALVSEGTDKRREQMRAESYARLQMYARLDDATIGDKIRVEERITKLFSLDGPSMYALRDVEGN